MSSYVKLQGTADKILNNLKIQNSKVIKPSEVAAINKTIAKIKTDGVKETASKVGVSQKLVRKRTDSNGSVKGDRIALRKAKRNQRYPYGDIYLYTRDIPSILIGNAKTAAKTRRRPRGSGVRVKGRHYKHSWIMPAGRQGGNNQIFSRMSKKRSPLKVMKIQFIQPARKIFNERLKKSRSDFKRYMNHELKWRSRNARTR